MRIAIDLRPLMGGHISGVEKYIVSMLNALFDRDHENEYILWVNALGRIRLEHRFSRYSNVRFKRTYFPNKLLNLALSLLRWPKVDRLAGKGVDIFWVPDPRPAPVSRHCRKLITFHDLSFEEFKDTFNRKTRLWHKLVRPRKEALEADKIIAVSHFTRNKLTTVYGVPASRIRVIHEAVPVLFDSRSLGYPQGGQGLSAQEPAAEAAIVREKYGLLRPYFLCLSTLEPRKNLAFTVNAYRTWQQKTGIPVDLVIAGRERPDIFASSATAMPEGVRLIGFVEEAEKQALFGGALAFLYPSLYEGFGLPILEAMAYGTPVVCSNLSSMPEVAGDAALLIDPKSPESLIDALDALFQDDSLRQTLIQKGRTQAASFSWERAVEALRGLF